MDQKIEALSAEISALRSELESSCVRVIDEDTTLDVATTAELQAALTDLDYAHITSAATVTIDLADGAYEFAAPLTVDHPDGAHIRLVGDEGDPTLVTLEFTGTDGVRLLPGRQLGALDGLTLLGEGATGSGLVVEANATLAVGSLDISGFGYAGLRVTSGGSVIPDDPSCATGSIQTTSMTYGVVVSDGGVAVLCDASASGMSEAGFNVSYSAYLSLNSATSTDNGGDGYYATMGSTLVVNEGSSEGNGDVGYEAHMGSVLYADQTSSTGDSLGYYAGEVSALSADNTTTTDAVRTSYTSYWNSYLSAQDATADGETSTTDEYGLVARNGGVLSAGGAEVSSVATGFYASGFGYIFADASTNANVTVYGYLPDYGGAISFGGAGFSGTGDLTSSTAVTDTAGYAWY